MLDFFSSISGMFFTEALFIVFFFLAFFSVPFFSSRFFYDHLSSREILKNVVICGLLILPSLLTFNIFYSFIQSLILSASINIVGSDVIDWLANGLTSGRFLSSIVLFFVYGLWTIISGILNKDQRFYWFIH
ncbi:hypothetical protein DU62_16000 [Methanosarcina mazei]|uniref:Uncharacterized protein n=1 Tax=Methanosarcina mazei TaxID=2209 RepID=A0A0F8MWN6_METMZ|nr:hypothetical protein DU46_17715 [Methanosarcina mazei]KKG84513.1 hypothetical protein DU61_18285 [Methanosarcina mazei]KKH07220.1 hypothetical protein DU62_16000 [Methanosarcina mazei]KKH09961.1 hypothetical protein DU51_00570 [Methanosarcina mazei]